MFQLATSAFCVTAV